MALTGAKRKRSMHLISSVHFTPKKNSCPGKFISVDYLLKCLFPELNFLHAPQVYSHASPSVCLLPSFKVDRSL